MGVRKDSIQTLIETNLSSSKDPKITPADHREVVQEVINYIDNRLVTNPQGVIYAGSVQIAMGVDQSYWKVTVPLGTTLPSTVLDYVVVGCFTAPTAKPGAVNCRCSYTIRNRTSTQFDILLTARNPLTAAQNNNSAVINLTFEYLLYLKEEVQ